MTTRNERNLIYAQIFSFMNFNRFTCIPTPFEAICADLQIELVPLSKIAYGMGISKSEVMDNIWHNENGHLMPCKNKRGGYRFKIAYNDDPTHEKRRQFTIAEELSHMVQGHFLHDMYSVFDASLWDDSVYQKHEECGRIGAGLMVCPPPIFYNLPSYFNAEDIQGLCEVSAPCAATRYDVLKKYKHEIVPHPSYAVLNRKYQNVAYLVPCHACGGSPVIPEEGICESCAREFRGYYDYYYAM